MIVFTLFIQLVMFSNAPLVATNYLVLVTTRTGLTFHIAIFLNGFRWEDCRDGHTLVRAANRYPPHTQGPITLLGPHSVTLHDDKHRLHRYAVRRQLRRLHGQESFHAPRLNRSGIQLVR